MEASRLVESPETQLERLRSRDERYSLGQFFTPGPIAKLMGQAVDEVEPETVLDPGVGGGVLLRSVDPRSTRYGIDIDPTAVELASASLGSQGGCVELAVGNFTDLDTWPLSETEFDAVISNPPYIRHHNLSKTQKALAKHYSTVYGMDVSRLSGSYVYFFLEAILRLRPDGRLVFITPAEFLDVRYGEAVKRALLAHCTIDEILVLQLDELAFDGVLTTSAITVATKRGRKNNGAVRLSEGTLNSSVKRTATTDVPRKELPASLAWTSLLPSRAARIAPLLESRTEKLGKYARVRRGIASGDNSFFCLNQDKVDQWCIEPSFLVPVAIGARSLPSPGHSFDALHWNELRSSGQPCWLFWCHESKESLAGTNALRYIEHGEKLGVHERFNCRTRSPWYSVEKVAPPDYFVTYMSRERARFVRNEADARCMTSLLNLWALPGVDSASLRMMLEAPTNAQVLREFGRTYGSGLTKIEPGELLRLPVPPVAHLDR